MRRRTVALGALLLGAVAGPLPAQRRDAAAPVDPGAASLPKFSIDEDPFRIALGRTYWRWLASSACRQAPWTPDLTSSPRFTSSVWPLRQAFADRLGPLGDTTAGDIIQRIPVSSTSRYRVDFVVFTGRFSPMLLRALVVTPVAESPAPVVLLVHGFGTLPRQTIGWRYGGAEAIKYADSPLEHLAVDLAEQGYAVVIPWIRDDVSSQWPYQPWVSVDRLGSLFSAKAGGTGMGILVSELHSVLDLVGKTEGMDTARVAAVGWEEGADLAAAVTALDPRVKALVRLMPPIDRLRWRATPEGVQANAASLQIDCTFGESELAAMIAPRPILYDWTTDDPTFVRSRFFVDTTIVDRARSFYRALGLGGGVTIQTGRARGLARPGRIAKWLRQTLSVQGPKTLATGATPPLPPDPAALLPSRDTSIARLASMVNLSGSCTGTPLPPPRITNTLDFLTSAAPWRRYIARRFRVPPPAGTTPRIVIRDTLELNPDFILEWIVTTPTETGLPLMGLLATPVGISGPYPALLTFDGDFAAGEPFGLRPKGRTQYLKGYARDVARRGVIVFAPVVPGWFGEAATSILAARDPHGPTMWGTVLAQSRAATDLLLARHDVDSTRMTIQGISWAGVIALYSMALDPRLTTLVYSNPVTTSDTLFARPSGGPLLAAWYAPTCGTFDQAARYLIAPRRFIWENGIADANGFEGSPQEAARAVQEIYRSLGIPERFTLLRHGGGHEEQPALLEALDPYRRPTTP